MESWKLFYNFVNIIKLNNMGKGDKKTRRGKINQGSYGKTRPKKKVSKAVVSNEKPTKVVAEKPAKKETRAKATKAVKETSVEEKPKAKRVTKKKEEE